MKVMSYNTLFGGYDGENGKRYAAQVELINTVKPDILLVQEMKGYLQNGRKMLFEMEDDINMRGFIAPAVHTGQNTGVFIKSPIKPISVEVDSVHFHNAIVLLKLNIPSFDKPLTVISAHLCPFGSHVRLREVYYLTNYAADDDFTLLAGDFNSVSPYDPDPVGLEELPTRFRARYVTSDGSAVDKTTLETFYQAGFVDIAYILGKNDETTVPAVSFKGKEFVPFRSDYILTTKALSGLATSYSVIKNSITDNASDHYPVVADFEV